MHRLVGQKLHNISALQSRKVTGKDGLMTVLVIQVPASTKLTEDPFYDLCRANPEVKIERTAQGALVFVPPTGGETGKRTAKLTSRFVV